ncbi:MAG: DNA primase [Rhodopirellula sp.]|nr:DNA primase [Rhodopirellula sp.]
MNDVDNLIASTPLDAVLNRFGQPLAEHSSGEHRMTCPFNESCAETSYGQLTVNLDDPARLIFCHSCRIRGNLLTLLHGLEYHRPPQGGRLRGDEFKAAVATLRLIASQGTSESATAPTPSSPAEHDAADTASPPMNIPLRRHPKEAARKIEDLYADLISDHAEMSPNAASYFRERPWLTPEVCKEWGVGYLPRNGRSLLRGWIVYTQRNQRGDVVSYSGRDPNYDEKSAKWIRDGLPEGKKPNKHRYVSGYQRGLELYGQQSVRLEQERIRRSLQTLGLIVVEGANDVIRLDGLDVAAVGLCSNRATDEQILKIVRFSREAAQSRVVLLPDCDREGEEGFRELLWQLNEAQLDVRLGWSSAMFDRAFAGRQPEQITAEEWSEKLLPSLEQTR